MKRISLVFFILLMVLPAFPALSSVSECQEFVGEKQGLALQEMKRLEDHFVKMEWAYWRHQQLFYGPLWNAEIKKRDSFSDAVKAEGEVAAGRYKNQAQFYFDEASGESQKIWQALARLKDQTSLLSRGCDFAEYQSCLEGGREPLDQALRNLEKLLKKNEESQGELTEKIHKTLSETLSEHLDFGERYQEERGVFYLKIYPLFLDSFRLLDEILETNNPAGKCCAVCSDENQKKGKDLVLEQVKPDAQGMKGVAGKIVNQTSLTAAFERKEAEEKAKKS